MSRGTGAGKRSVKAMHSSLVGASASQQIRSAEWRGELPWVDGHHPPGGVQTPQTTTTEPWTDIDYNKPWFEDKDGAWYCNLCGAWATDMHVYSTKHSQRAANPEWYGFPPTAAAGIVQGQAPQSNTGWTAPDYSKPYFEKRDGDYYCILCSAWATDGHVNSDKHQRRVEQNNWYDGSNAASSTAAATSSWPGSPDYSADYFEFRDGDWYCKLCANWATPDHVASDKHKKRASYPDWYGFSGTNSSGVSTTAGAQVQATATLPPPWEQHFSAEHKTNYYYNPLTGTSKWEMPVAHGQQPYANMVTSSPWPASTAVTASAPPAMAALPYPWERHQDEQAQRPYYHNRETHKSQWEHPFGSHGLHEC